MTYKFPLTEYGIGEDSQGNTHLVGKIGDKHVGILVLGKPDRDNIREAIQVWTDKDYRRIGVANHLWKLAQVNKLNPRHSPNRTTDGTIWSQQIKG
jgi:hypothetical protein